jgi:hypothetical protein
MQTSTAGSSFSVASEMARGVVGGVYGVLLRRIWREQKGKKEKRHQEEVLQRQRRENKRHKKSIPSFIRLATPPPPRDTRI